MASYLESIDSQLSQWVNPTDANNAAIAQTVAVANPDGNAMSTATPTANTNVNVNQVQTWLTTPLPTEKAPLAATTDTTNADVASTNAIAAATDIQNTATSEIESQKNLTQQLSQIDTLQKNTKIESAQANLAELTVNEKTQQIQKTANELEYQDNLRKNQEEEIASLKVQQASELVRNDAEAAEMKAKTDKAERDAVDANEVAQMQSNVAFAKLGGSFSWAAINTAQKLFTDGAYNIATLKSSNAYNYASLKVKINTVAFEHTQAIWKLVQATAEKEFASKERLRDFIGNSQNNILLGKKESQSAIQEAITTYKNEQQMREDKLYSDINAANDRLSTATKEIQTAVDTRQTTEKKTIDALIANWQWSSLSAAQQNDYENNAWLPIGSVNRNTTTNITSWINSRLKEIVWSTVAIPTTTLFNMQNDIHKYMKLGYPMNTAIQMTVDKYKNQIPEAKAAIESAHKKATLTNTKTQAQIDKLNSEAKENLASIDKMKADTARAAASARSAWVASAKPNEKFLDTIIVDWKTYNRYTTTVGWKANVVSREADINLANQWGKIPTISLWGKKSVPVVWNEETQKMEIQQ